MRNKLLVSLLLLVVLLVACNGNKEGPSDKEAEEIIYGMYLKDASIVGKEKCELTTWMEEDGQTEVWLVEYQFEGSNDTHGFLLTKQDDKWQTYLSGVDSCPEE
ncbi:MAG: hypothetical protein PVF45_15090 [Anaerolineae bacterium]|jgi:hypothetical protein